MDPNNTEFAKKNMSSMVSRHLFAAKPFGGKGLSATTIDSQSIELYFFSKRGIFLFFLIIYFKILSRETVCRTSLKRRRPMGPVGAD
jgi:hypothetical protein